MLEARPINILICEDETEFSAELTQKLTELGHNVLAVCTTLEESKEFIGESVRNWSYENLHLVLLDANLHDNKDRSGQDAGKIFDALRRGDRMLNKRVATAVFGISFSVLRDDYGIPVDDDPGKDSDAIVAAIHRKFAVA